MGVADGLLMLDDAVMANWRFKAMKNLKGGILKS